jgi:hypothetical protein
MISEGTMPPTNRGPVPGLAPAWIIDLAAELEAHGPQDQRQENDHHGEVEAGEADGIKRWEGGKDGAAAKDQPDLVSFPGRADKVEQHAPFVVSAGDERQKRSHAEVATTHDGEADQQDAEQKPPDQPERFIVEGNGAHDPSSWVAGVAGRVAMTKSSSSSLEAITVSLGPALITRTMRMTMMTNRTV